MAEQKQKEEAGITKIESESVLDCLDFDILAIDKDLRIVFANRAFLDAKGVKLREAIGQHCYELTHNLKEPCKPPKDPCPIAEVMKTGRPVVKTHEHSVKGSRQLVNVTAAPIDKGGRFFCTFLCL